MFHLWTLVVTLGFVAFVSAGIDTSVTCKDEKTHVLACEQTIVGLVNAQLKPYGKTFSTTNLDNTTESELLDEKTRDVVCSAANAEHVSCMVDNITACPAMATDADIVSTWIASLIAPNLDVLNSVEHVCDFFKESVCSYRELRLNKCYLSIVGDTVTLNQKVDMCVSDKMDKLTCMIEVYKECKPYLNLTSNDIIAANIKEHIADDQWNTFSNGTELCDCYAADSCHSSLIKEIASITTRPNSSRETFTISVEVSEILCSNISLVHCTKKGLAQSCSKVIHNYNIISADIGVYTATVDKMCKTVNTQKFKTNKPCVINQLTESYQPCMEKEKLPFTVTNSRDMRKLYKCLSSALDGKCNGDYTNTAFEIMKTSFNKVIDCDVTSNGYFVHPNYIVMMVLVIHLNLLIGYTIH